MIRLLLAVTLLYGVLGLDLQSEKHRFAKEAVKAKDVHPHIRQFTGGTNFVFAVINSHINANDTSYTEVITLTITNYDGGNLASVVIDSPYPGFQKQTLNINPHDSQKVTLPAEIQTNYKDLDLGYLVYENKSLTVTSTTQVSVVVSNAHSDGTSEDDYVIYPACTLGTSYRTVADEANYKGVPSTNVWTIIATQDNTKVTFSPRVTTSVLPLLNKGETLTLASQSIFMTNYVISSDKPIALINGAVCGFGFFNPLICNHQAVMMMPTSDNALQFPFTQFQSEEKGELMIFGISDGTGLYFDGVQYDVLYNQEILFVSLNGSVLISTDKPSYCAAISNMRSDGQGSPFMVHLPAPTQFTSQPWMQVSTGLVLRPEANHLIRIQASLTDAGKFAVDGWPISGLFYTRQGRSDYYCADFPVKAGTHVITSSDPTAKYSVTVYGYAHFTAYAFTPGLDLPSTGTC